MFLRPLSVPLNPVRVNSDCIRDFPEKENARRRFLLLPVAPGN